MSFRKTRSRTRSSSSASSSGPPRAVGRKVIVMPDGVGSAWEIKAQGRGGSASNGLWADQVKNGQVLTFRKPKGFGVWWNVIEIGFLGDLDPGDRAVFIWRRD